MDVKLMMMMMMIGGIDLVLTRCPFLEKCQVLGLDIK